MASGNPDRSTNPKRQPKMNWDKVPTWNGPGSWEASQPLSESYKQALADKKDSGINTTNAAGD